MNPSERARTLARRTYLSLGAGELVSSAVFVLAMGMIGTAVGDPGAMRVGWIALVPLVLVLVQAGAYWLAARTWVTVGRMPRTLAAVYRVLRYLDLLVLVGALAGILVLSTHAVATVLALLVWGFGVIEYVNYFWVRLSYPASRWFREVTRWRTPRLVADLRRAR